MNAEEKKFKTYALLFFIVCGLCVLFYAYNKLGNTIGNLISEYYEFEYIYN